MIDRAYIGVRIYLGLFVLLPYIHCTLTAAAGIEASTRPSPLARAYSFHINHRIVYELYKFHLMCLESILRKNGLKKNYIVHYRTRELIASCRLSRIPLMMVGVGAAAEGEIRPESEATVVEAAGGGVDAAAAAAAAAAEKVPLRRRRRSMAPAAAAPVSAPASVSPPSASSTWCAGSGTRS